MLVTGIAIMLGSGTTYDNARELERNWALVSWRRISLTVACWMFL
jgi:hypothetical protein